jgi:hypothetical protein
MTQPKFAPITEEHEVREVQRIGPPAPWIPHRPGEHRPAPQHGRSAGFGVPGPDQGYALGLAQRFEGRLGLELGEHAEDVLAGAVAIALCRAAIFGRAPVLDDIAIALTLFGYLPVGERNSPPGDLVEFRKEGFRGAGHDYWVRRALADEVPETTLRLNLESLAERLESDPASWRELVSA